MDCGKFFFQDNHLISFSWYSKSILCTWKDIDLIFSTLSPPKRKNPRDSVPLRLSSSVCIIVMHGVKARYYYTSKGSIWTPFLGKGG